MISKISALDVVEVEAGLKCLSARFVIDIGSPDQGKNVQVTEVSNAFRLDS